MQPNYNYKDEVFEVSTMADMETCIKHCIATQSFVVVSAPEHLANDQRSFKINNRRIHMHTYHITPIQCRPGLYHVWPAPPLYYFGPNIKYKKR